MNGKWWVGLAMVGLVACGTPPPSRDCTDDRQCYPDEYCDLSVMLCTNFTDGGVDGGRRDAGALDGGRVDGGMTDAGHSDAGATDAGDSDAGEDDAGVDAGCTPFVLCRALAGPCDLEEVCTTEGVCPPDEFEMSTTLCRPAGGGVACDAPEFCTGVSAQCPADLPAAASVPCRASAGVCDLAEACDGVSFDCPADLKASVSTSCRLPAGVCDAEEFCDGIGNDCPADMMLSAATVCRGDAGVCDLAERCTGSSPQCPADALVDAGVTCRTSADLCDAVEACTGASVDCPADGFLPSTTPCRNAVNTCDLAESCTGSGAACPADVFQSSSVSCAAQTCSSGSVTPARFCAGTSATCNAAGANISCNGYQCTGSTCRTTCGSSNDCLSTHFCDGTSCSPLRANGQGCTSAATGFQCLSGSCIQVYPDNDLDGYGAGSPVFHCGMAATSGFSTNNSDCCDTDGNAKPGQTAYFTSARTGCGGYDYDCVGGETQQYTSSGVCQSTGTCTTRMCPSAGSQGWSGSAPACGTSGTWVTNCGITALGGGCSGGESCNTIASTSRTQGCR